jgi:homoserine dehydrogenase
MTSLVQLENEVIDPWRAPATARVALAGCGAVGSALLRELVARRETLADRYGVQVAFDRALLTTDVDDFLETEVEGLVRALRDEDVDAIAIRIDSTETVSGRDPA